MKNFFDKMYSNIGGKLRTLAKVCGVIGIVCAVICVLVEVLTVFDSFEGILAVSGLMLGLLCVVTSWPLYAFGQLVDDVHAIRTGGAAKAPVNDELPDL
ncbi:MAG: hypothetical protein K2N78_09930 [Oscillospiraceae bacterium]|nr:hypothetical protein [Oscillospiraceae bacterium]